MNTRRMGEILAFVVLAAAADGALAVDYTLNVPVNVTNLSPSMRPTLNCYILTSSKDSIAMGFRQHVMQIAPPGSIASVSKPIPFVNGAYSGTLQIVFSLSDAQVGYAESYRCEFADGLRNLAGPVAKPNSNSVMSVEGKVQ